MSFRKEGVVARSVSEDPELDAVMLALGKALFAAQAFEMNLGTTLIALTMHKSERPLFSDQAAARKWLDEVDRLPIGALKKELKKLELLSDDTIDQIGEINQMRIKVAHHFANRWSDHLDNEERRAEAVEELLRYEAVFLDAAMQLYDSLTSARVE